MGSHGFYDKTQRGKMHNGKCILEHFFQIRTCEGVVRLSNDASDRVVLWSRVEFPKAAKWRSKPGLHGKFECVHATAKSDRRSRSSRLNFSRLALRTQKGIQYTHTRTHTCISLLHRFFEPSSWLALACVECGLEPLLIASFSFSASGSHPSLSPSSPALLLVKTAFILDNKAA